MNPINATAERVATAPMFRDSYARRRCIVPVDNFFEWKAVKGAKAKQPYAVAMKSGEPFGIAGIWDDWKHPDTGEVVRTLLHHNDNRQRAGGQHPRPDARYLAGDGL